MKRIKAEQVVSVCAARVGAIKKFLGAKDQIFVGGESLTSADLAQVYQEALDARATAAAAKGAYLSALVGRNTSEAKRIATDVALKPYVVQRFGAESAEAHDFGYAPKKLQEKTVVTKARAALLGKATREARGTTGKKKKRQIKGTLSPDAVATLEALAGATPSRAAES